MKLIFKILILFFLVANIKCGNSVADDNNDYNFETIKISQAIKDIASLKNQKDIQGIYKYINSENPQVRRYAVLSIGACYLPSSSSLIEKSLKDEDETVRKAAAYALGILKDNDNETILISAYSTETSIEVKKEILEAIGMCGSQYGLNYLCSVNSDNNLIKEGIAYGLVHFAARNIVSEQSSEKAIDLLKHSEPLSSLRQIISFYFALNEKTDFSKYYNSLYAVYKSSQNDVVKANLLLAFGKSKTTEALNLIKNELKTSQSPIILVNAIKASENFSYNSTKKLIYNLLYSNDNSVASAAGDFFIKKGISSDVAEYSQASKEALFWETRVKMTKAVLLYGKNKQETVNSVMAGFDATNNLYEKAGILKALSPYPLAYRIIFDVFDTTTTPVLQTAAVQSLTEMFENSNFDYYANKLKQKNNDNLYNEFFLFFKNIISNSGDNVLIYYASKIFSNSKMKKYIEENFENTYFLNNAKSYIILPRDLKVYKALCKAQKSINNQSCPQSVKITGSEIDWEILETLPKNLYIKIFTSRGNIIVKLNTQQAPVTVAFFVRMIKNNTYENKYISRAIPNLGVFFGGKRGDGWESENYAFVADLYPTHFERGMVALKNLGLNYMSANWFITTFPTIELDGQYTIIGKIVKGIDVAEKLIPNDKIYSVEILEQPVNL